MEPLALQFALSGTLNHGGSHHGRLDPAKLDLAAWEWTLLDTWLGLNPASKTDGYPFEDRAYNTEVIYSGSNQDYDSQDEKSDTVDEGTEHFCHILQIAPLSDYKCLVALTVVTSKNKSRSVIKL